MRKDGGLEVIKKAISKLEKRHLEHIAAYGEGNERRLTGKHETADIKTFSWVSNQQITLTNVKKYYKMIETLAQQ